MSSPGTSRKRPAITKEEFAALAPYLRGWMTYLRGADPDEPHVPDERCPYPGGSSEAADWDRGQWAAYLDTLDSEE